MHCEQDFLKAIHANGKELTIRMVFADWLDERNDPRGPGYRVLGAGLFMPLDAQWRIPYGHNRYCACKKHADERFVSFRAKRSRSWEWWNTGSLQYWYNWHTDDEEQLACLPYYLLSKFKCAHIFDDSADELPCPPANARTVSYDYLTRIEAEDAFAVGFGRLKEKQQALIINFAHRRERRRQKELKCMKKQTS